MKQFTRAKTDYDAALTIKPNLTVAQKGSADMAGLIIKQSSGGPPPLDQAPKPEHDHN